MPTDLCTDFVRGRNKPLYDLERKIKSLRTLVLDKSMDRGTLVQELAADISNSARRLKNWEYRNGTFGLLMEVIAKSFEPPNRYEIYSELQFEALLNLFPEKRGVTKELDLRPAEVTSIVRSLRVRGIEADYVASHGVPAYK